MGEDIGKHHKTFFFLKSEMVLGSKQVLSRAVYPQTRPSTDQK